MKKLFLFICCSIFCSFAHAQSVYTDSHLAEQLKSDLGGFIVEVNYYKGKKGFSEEDLNKYTSVEELLKAVGEPKKPHKNIRLYLLSPDDKQKEKPFKLHSISSFFIFVGDAGEYTLTRLTLMGSSALTTSHRIFEKVIIEGGKLKYLGEFKIIDFSRMLTGFKKTPRPHIFYDFEPDVFQQDFQQAYPLSTQYLVSKKLGN